MYTITDKRVRSNLQSHFASNTQSERDGKNAKHAENARERGNEEKKQEEK